MATIEDLRSWIERDITRFANPDNHLSVVEDSHGKFRFHMFTDNNQYHVVARESFEPSFTNDGRVALEEKGYLGCTASSRKPRAGEDWTRGRDMADGPLEEGTWDRILKEIVCYELVRVAGVSPSQFQKELVKLLDEASLEEVVDHMLFCGDLGEVTETDVTGWFGGVNLPTDRNKMDRALFSVRSRIRFPDSEVARVF